MNGRLGARDEGQQVRLTTVVSEAANAWAIVDASLASAADVDIAWLPPPPDDYAMAPDALRFLASLIRHLKPHHILEFGSGLSTRVLAWACRDFGDTCSITSVDHDPEFGRKAAHVLRGKSLPCRVRVQIAPLVVRECGEKHLPIYYWRPERFASRLPFDLVVIDGPPGVLGGREGTLYQAMNFVRPGTIVLLDDADREQERSALRQWQGHLEGAIEVRLLEGFKRGLAVVVVQQPIPMTDVAAYRLGLAMQDIRSVIPSSDNFILVEENQWIDRTGTSQRPLPFLERHGEYWGPPADSVVAISELERLRQSGADFIAFGWPAFWWLDHYSDFHRHLRSRPCVLENDRVIVFDLRGPRAG